MKDTAAALRWIVGILRKHDIPFEISGGFAARMYGATRELADIDIDIPEARFPEILSEVKEYIIFGPEQYRDENWDLLLMTLRYAGQDIDIGGAYESKVFDENKGEWVTLRADLSRTVPREAYGITVPIIDKEDLIASKAMLGREVDKIDIEQMAKVGTPNEQ